MEKECIKFLNCKNEHYRLNIIACKKHVGILTVWKMNYTDSTSLYVKKRKKSGHSNCVEKE